MKQSIPGGQAIRTFSAQNHGKARHVNDCRFLDHGTSSPAGCRQVFWQIRLRQAAGQEQPAVVGDDPDFPPASGQQRLNAVHQTGDQFGNPMGQPAAFLVAGRNPDCRTPSRRGRSGLPVSAAAKTW